MNQLSGSAAALELKTKTDPCVSDHVMDTYERLTNSNAVVTCEKPVMRDTIRTELIASVKSFFHSNCALNRPVILLAALYE